MLYSVFAVQFAFIPR